MAPGPDLLGWSLPAGTSPGRGAGPATAAPPLPPCRCRRRPCLCRAPAGPGIGQRGRPSWTAPPAAPRCRAAPQCDAMLCCVPSHTAAGTAWGVMLLPGPGCPSCPGRRRPVTIGGAREGCTTRQLPSRCHPGAARPLHYCRGGWGWGGSHCLHPPRSCAPAAAAASDATAAAFATIAAAASLPLPFHRCRFFYAVPTAAPPHLQRSSRVHPPSTPITPPHTLLPHKT